MKLLLNTIKTFLIGFLFLGLVLFLPAGTFGYWQAWVFMIIFLIPVITLYLVRILHLERGQTK